MNPRMSTCGPALLALFLFLPAPTGAQSAREAPARVSLSASAALFVSSSQPFRDVYGPGLPLTVEAEVGVVPGMSVFSGLRFLRVGGQTVDDAGSDESFGLRFTSYTIRAGLRFNRPVGSLRLSAGAGIAHVRFREDWRDVDLDVDGSDTGFLVHGGVGYPIGRRLSLIVGVEYSSVTVDASAWPSKVNLGGVDVMGGVRVSLY